MKRNREAHEELRNENILSMDICNYNFDEKLDISEDHCRGPWGDVVVGENDNSNRFVLPFVPRVGARVYAVKAGMGMGKTTQLKIFILQRPGASFLVVSFRISLCHTQREVLWDFKHYSSRDWSAKRLICQYEKLHRVTHVHDYVILDKVRSVVCCMTSKKTNGAHIRTNAMIFKS